MCETDSNKTGVKLHARQFHLVSFCSYQYQAMTRLCPTFQTRMSIFTPTYIPNSTRWNSNFQTFWTQTCEKKTIELTPCSTQPIDKVDFFYNAFNLFKTPVCCTTQHYCGYGFSNSYIAPRQRPTNPECQAFMNFIDESNNLSKQFSQKYCWWKKSCTTWDI